MTGSRNLLRGATALVVLCAAAAWVASLLWTPRAETLQNVSNLGLTGAALAAGAAGWSRSRRDAGPFRRFWRLLGSASLCWGAGQVVWTWYESVLGREVPFPSLADWGYLCFPPLAAAALLSLPLAAPTLAGRARTFLDGMMVAASVLLCSWILVLGPVFRAGGDGLLAQSIALAYPIGDVIVMTIVAYTWLRARQLARPMLSVSLPLVATGLLALAAADSMFSYLTAVDRYTSGSFIDIGWFLGFLLLFLAALRRGEEESAAPPQQENATRPLGNLLPYAAVLLAVLTSVVDLWRTGHPSPVVSWIRSAILVLLVARQVLTLRENHALARHLENRVEERTAELRASQQRFASLVQHSSDVVTVVDPLGVVSYQSASSQRVLGYDADALVGRSVCDLMEADEGARFLTALEVASKERLRTHTVHSTWRHATGRSCRVEVTIANLLDNPNVGGLVLNTRDVTERAVLEERLVQQAFTDSLTGLPNRALFRDRLQHAIARAERNRAAVTVLFLDLDGFKAVNDTLGHSAGDELLVQVSGRLRSLVRASDTMARFGGDEFAVLIEDIDDEHVIELAQRINDVLGVPFALASQHVHVAASIGIAHFGSYASNSEQLLRNADLAMYQAKASGSGGHAVYHPGMHATLVSRVRLESDLRRALERDEFVMYYQPMVSLATGRITGVEALVRWQHPERGMVSPDEFIPMAEATGLIRQVGAWVLQEACRQAAHWLEAGKPGVPPLRMSVNVSPRQLEQPDFAEFVRDTLAETGLPARCLTIEMTEGALMDRSQHTLATLVALREMGVRLAIDDFGTGYSSLSYLHNFPVDVLKIDRTFIQRLSDGGDVALVSTILRLGQSMNLEVVAEGIERPREMLTLRRQGCSTGQGHHFSPPVPSSDIDTMLAEQEELEVLEERRPA